MKINEIHESTVAGSIAAVAKPLGELQTRSKPEKAPKVVKGKKYANTISEGSVKKLAYDLLHMDADEFQQVYKQAKDFFKKPDNITLPKPSPASTKTGSKSWHDTGYVDKKAAKQSDEPIQEDELKEDDLIIMPGMIRNKDKSFIAKSADRRDHEVEMARSDVYAAAKDAMRIFNILENRTEDDGLMGWQQSYITLAADYLNSVADSLEYDSVANENVVGKMITKLAQHSAKDLPNTPEVQRAIANHAMKIEKNVDNAVKAGTGAAGAVAGKAIYDKRKDKSNEGAGVIAGGMSNFEEGYNPLDDERREQAKMDAEKRKFKTDELEAELRNEPQNNYAVYIDGRYWKTFADKNQAENIARSLIRKGKKAKVHLAETPSSDNGADFLDRLKRGPLAQNPKGSASEKMLLQRYIKTPMIQDYDLSAEEWIGQATKWLASNQQNIKKNFPDVDISNLIDLATKMYEDFLAMQGKLEEDLKEEQLDEKKDACYHKVKSRYKVWPSAYASGALVKCRKVGASNWGNKSK
jgi:hypothetical protein